MIGVLFRGDFHIMSLIITDSYIWLVAFASCEAVATQISLYGKIVIAEMVDLVLAFSHKHIDGYMNIPDSIVLNYCWFTVLVVICRVGALYSKQCGTAVSGFQLCLEVTQCFA